MKAKGDTAARGYGTDHRRERKRLTPLVDSGNAYCMQPVCLMPARWIQPGTPWALGHNDARTAWIGPTHAVCNQRDGASKGGKVIAARRSGTTTAQPGRSSRDW